MPVLPLAAILGGFLIGICVERIIAALRQPEK
jgi:hypothetical protein